MKRIALKLLSFLVRLSLAVLLGTSLLSGLVPNSIIASAVGIDSGRACCSGKSAGHCKIALKVQRPAQEQMCGLKQTVVDDAATIVADEEDDSATRSAGKPSVGSTCANDCLSCSARSSQQLKQFKRVVILRAVTPGPTDYAGFRSRSKLTFSSAALTLFSPRGPPATLS